MGSALAIPTTVYAPPKPIKHQSDGFDHLCSVEKTTKGVKDVVLKPFNNIVEWMKYASKDPVNQHLLNTQKYTKFASGLLSFPEALAKVNDVRVGIEDLAKNQHIYSTKEKWKKGVNVVINVDKGVSEAVVVAKALHSIGAFPLSKQGVKVMGGVGDATLLVGCAKGVVDDSKDIKKCYEVLSNSPTSKVKKDEKARLGHNWASLIKNIAYIALAAIGLVSLAVIGAAPQWAILSLVTVTVAIGLFTTFYDKIAQYKKRPEMA